MRGAQRRGVSRRQDRPRTPPRMEPGRRTRTAAGVEGNASGNATSEQTRRSAQRLDVLVVWKLGRLSRSSERRYRVGRPPSGSQQIPASTSVRGRKRCSSSPSIPPAISPGRCPPQNSKHGSAAKRSRAPDLSSTVPSPYSLCARKLGTDWNDHAAKSLDRSLNEPDDRMV
jgi:hypothetical protein